MSTAKMTVDAVAPEEKRLYQVGGISSLAIGLAYIIIIGLYAQVGAPPIGGEAWLTYLAGKTTLWWAIVGISVLTNFLFIPVALSLYYVLSRVNKITMLIAVAFVGLFVVLELAVNWSCYAVLLMLSADYAAATNDLQRAAYVAAANVPSALIASPLALVYAIGTLSFGFLLISFVMRKSVFSKVTAYLGVITGILGMVALAGVSIAVILNAVCATVWLFLVGYRLYRLSDE